MTLYELMKLVILSLVCIKKSDFLFKNLILVFQITKCPRLEDK